MENSPLDLPGQHHLPRLALERLFALQVLGKDVARQLHGHRAEALAPAQVLDVARQRAEEAAVVDAAVAVEALVLHGQKGARDVGGNAFQGHDDAPLRRQVRHQAVAPVEHAAGLRRRVLAQRGHATGSPRPSSAATGTPAPPRRSPGRRRRRSPGRAGPSAGACAGPALRPRDRVLLRAISCRGNGKRCRGKQGRDVRISTCRYGSGSGSALAPRSRCHSIRAECCKPYSRAAAAPRPPPASRR